MEVFICDVLTGKRHCVEVTPTTTGCDLAALGASRCGYVEGLAEIEHCGKVLGAQEVARLGVVQGDTLNLRPKPRVVYTACIRVMLSCYDSYMHQCVGCYATLSEAVPAITSAFRHIVNSVFRAKPFDSDSSFEDLTPRSFYEIWRDGGEHDNHHKYMASGGPAIAYITKHEVPFETTGSTSQEKRVFCIPDLASLPTREVPAGGEQPSALDDLYLTFVRVLVPSKNNMDEAGEEDEEEGEEEEEEGKVAAEATEEDDDEDSFISDDDRNSCFVHTALHLDVGSAEEDMRSTLRKVVQETYPSSVQFDFNKDPSDFAGEVSDIMCDFHYAHTNPDGPVSAHVVHYSRNKQGTKSSFTGRVVRSYGDASELQLI